MRKSLPLLVVALAVAIVSLSSVKATDQSQNLIQNGLFEEFVSYGDHLVGRYWSTFVINGNPLYGSNGFEPGQQMYSSGPAFTAGLYQQVNGATPGLFYYCYYGTAAKWGAMDSGKLDGHIGRTIGVDPTGGTDPNSPSVVWGSQVWDDAHWNWKDDPNANAPKVWVAAQSTQMTLFMKVLYPEGGNQATVWLDDAAIMPDPNHVPPTPTPEPKSIFVQPVFIRITPAH